MDLFNSPAYPLEENRYGNIDLVDGTIPNGYFRIYTVSNHNEAKEAYKIDANCHEALVGFNKYRHLGRVIEKPILKSIAHFCCVPMVLNSGYEKVNQKSFNSIKRQIEKRASFCEQLNLANFKRLLSKEHIDWFTDIAEKNGLSDIAANRTYLALLYLFKPKKLPKKLTKLLLCCISEEIFQSTKPIIEQWSVSAGVTKFIKSDLGRLNDHTYLFCRLAPIISLNSSDIDILQSSIQSAHSTIQAQIFERASSTGKKSLIRILTNNAFRENGYSADMLPACGLTREEFGLVPQKVRTRALITAEKGLADNRYVSTEALSVAAFNLNKNSLFISDKLLKTDYEYQSLDIEALRHWLNEGYSLRPLLRCAKWTQLSKLLVGAAHSKEVSLLRLFPKEYPSLISLCHFAHTNDRGKLDRFNYLNFLDFVGRLTPENIRQLVRFTPQELKTGLALYNSDIIQPELNKAQLDQLGDTVLLLLEIAQNEGLTENLLKYLKKTRRKSLHDYLSGVVSRRAVNGSLADIDTIFPAAERYAKAKHELSALGASMIETASALKAAGRFYRHCVGGSAYVRAAKNGGDIFLKVKPHLEAAITAEIRKGFVAHLSANGSSIKQAKGFANRNLNNQEKSVLHDIQRILVAHNNI